MTRIDGACGARSGGPLLAALRTAGSGRWSVLDATGPVLGVVAEAEYEVVSGRMLSGDALMLYTDGMLGQAEQLLRGDIADGARRLVETVGARHDDRALLLVRRN